MAHTPCLALQKTLHFPSPQPGVRRLALFQQGEWTQVWFGNIWVRIQSEKQESTGNEYLYQGLPWLDSGQESAY